MARPLRVDIRNGWYHVTARGNERRAVFRDDQDRQVPMGSRLTIHHFGLDATASGKEDEARWRDLCELIFGTAGIM